MHGEADFLPGIRVECYGGCAVLLLRSAAAVAHQDRLTQALAATLGHDDIVIRHQISDLRRNEVSTSHASGRAIEPERLLEGRELGQRYEIA